jgi:myxalamid-type polyketide synthase MxaD
MSQSDRLAQLKQVYQTVEKLQNKLEEMQQARNEPIAIIGMACRYPNGANSPEAFWDLLRDGRDGITEVPPDRWNADEFFDPHPDRPGKIATRWGGFVDHVSDFDTRFFGISPREAAHMDPQQRLLLEVAWEALEAAGQPADGLAGSATGVYIGMLNSEYGWLQFRDLASLDAYSGTGTSHSVASGRLSYVLGLQGPSVTLDTACSSSLVAIHLASQALRNRECDMALAGGVSVILSPLALMPFSRMGLLAADGRCKVLDSAADGFGSGEGCGLLVLKRLSDAEAAGDRILALIRGSAVNQDGRTNVLSAPNGRSQEAVIRKALANAQVEPGQLSLIELHGTGTSLGDPIETDALRAIFAAKLQSDADTPTSPRAPGVFLGAVKSNIGHTGAAAGVAGVIKAVVGMQHDTVPPNLHFRELNPHVNLANTPFVIPVQPMAWPRGESPRLAGISAFGWSGTNAHIILSDAPKRGAAQRAASDGLPAAVDAHLLPLSARSEAALRDLAAATADFLRSTAGQASCLGDIAYTAGVRRSHHPHRLAVQGAGHFEMADRLRAYLNGARPDRLSAGRQRSSGRRKLVFVFSPHGSQWPGMGRELWRQSPVFRDAIEACQAAMQPYVTWRLDDRLAADDSSWHDEIDVLQPCLFAIQVGLATVWRSWGVEPDAIVGHSMGEVAAAHIAGVLSLDDAARIICRRTQLLRAVTGAGTMGVVELSYEQARAAIAPYAGRLSIAASNSPRSTVIAGEPAALEALFDKLQEQEVYCGWGLADVASHTAHMDSINAELRQAIGHIQAAFATFPLYSTVTGALDDGRRFDAEYWIQHLNQTVMFAPVVRQLAESGHDVFLEIGPGPVLAPAIREGLEHYQHEGEVLATLRQNAGSYADALAGLGRLYALGYPVKWTRLYPAGTVVPLPAYPWQRERFWLAAGSEALASGGAIASRPSAGSRSASILGERIELAGETGRVVWENTYDSRFDPHLLQHRIFGRPIMPASAYVEAALAAAQGRRQVSQLSFDKGLILSETAPWTAGQVVVENRLSGVSTFRLYARAAGAWQQHASGFITSAPAAASTPIQAGPERARPGELREALTDHVDGQAVYRRFADLGIEYGAELQGLAELWWGRDEALARVELHARPARELDGGELPAAAIEPALQAFAWLVERLAVGNGTLYVPSAIGGITWARSGRRPAWARARLKQTTESAIIGSAELLDEDGELLLELDDIRFSAIKGASDGQVADWMYQVSWEPAETPAEAAPLTGLWLVFADEHGIGDGLAAAIAEGGGQPIVVRRDASLERISASEWHIRPGSVDDYRRLLQDTSLQDLRGIVHLWGMASDRLLSQSGQSLDHELTRDAATVLHLVQAIKHTAPEATMPIWLVTAGAQAVTSSDVAAAQAATWGLGHVLAEEHRELWGGLIDCDPDNDRAVTVRQIGAEVSSRLQEDRVAYRGERRFVARLARIEASAQIAESGPIFRADGAYLVTGGFGDIGMAVARWAVEQGARRLILLGRSDLPPRRQWRLLDADSDTGKRARAVLGLESLGAAIHYGAVDVGDPSALAGYLDTYSDEGWPAIRGVIHCAAVIEDRLLIDLDHDSLARVARPKASAAWHLHQYFLDRPLDFFVLFSSSGSLMGAAGQANYAAANALLDALAHARRRAGLPALSIDWGFWENMGFANTSGGRRAVAYMAAFGMLPFRASDALDALAHLLTRQDIAQAAAMKVDWRRWRSHSRLVGVAPFLRRMQDAEPGEPLQGGSGGDLRKQISEMEPGPGRLRALQDHIRSQLADVLRLDPSSIDLDTPLGSLGIDSFTAIELRNRFERGLGIQLSATLAWNYPTIDAMAPYLAERMGLALGPVEQPLPGEPALDDDLAAFLAQAEAMSEDELERLLKEGLAEE